MIGLCTDSGARLPELLVERFGIEIVPLTLRVGDEEYLDGVDALPEEARRACPSTIVVTPPSPGQFALAYEKLAERGVTEILGLHGGNGSGPLGSARLAAKHSPVPVRLVDPGVTGFALGCAVWAAAARLSTGGSVDDTLALLDALEVGQSTLSPTDGAECAAAALVREVLSWRPDTRLRVGLGAVDAAGEAVSAVVGRLLAQSPVVDEVVPFRLGPCDGLAPGSAGAYWFPA